jgi:hypothetical protein
LSDGAARLAARYPRAWHVIEADGAGPWLMETGLLPAADLRCGGANRDFFDCVDLGDGRTAVLRPQQMPDGRLLPTLAGAFAARPDLWRQHVDRHVFFWTEARRRDAVFPRLHSIARNFVAAAGGSRVRYSFTAEAAWRDRVLCDRQHRIDRARRCAHAARREHVAACGGVPER